VAGGAAGGDDGVNGRRTSEQPPRDSEELFDDVSWWRARAIEELGLSGVERMAAASDGAGYPAALQRLAGHLPGPGGTVLDLGAGLGGASSWLAGVTGARVVAVEPAAGSVAGAGVLWPGLPILRAIVEQVPIRSELGDAASLLGVLSLVEDLGALVSELRRILRPAGRVAVADLVLTGGPAGVEVSGPNTFRSLMRLTDELAAGGFRVLDAGQGETGSDERWGAAATRVDDEVERAHAGAAVLRSWQADQGRLRGLLADGVVAPGWLVAARIDRTVR
jgi:SAM-dependent methyltransferase